MIRSVSTTLWIVFAALSVLGLTTCYPKGSADLSAACGAEHVMPGHKAVWTYSRCDPFDGMWIQQGTLDSVTGAALGSRDVGRGMLSVRYTGLHNRGFQAGKFTYGIYFSADGFDRREATWNWSAFFAGRDNLRNQLTSQRMDVNCRSQACVLQNATDAMQFLDSREVWQWDCRWNSDDYTIVCEVTRPADPAFRIVMNSDMLGPYNALRYIGIGSKAYDGGWPSFDVTVTGLKVTIFE